MQDFSSDHRVTFALEHWVDLVQTYMSEHLVGEVHLLRLGDSYDPDSFGAYGKEEDETTSHVAETV